MSNVLNLKKIISKKNSKEYYIITVYYNDYNVVADFFISQDAYSSLIDYDYSLINCDNCLSIASRNNKFYVAFDENNILIKKD